MIAVLAAVFSLSSAYSPALANHGHGQGKGYCSKCGSSEKWGMNDKFFGKAHFLLENKDEIGLSEAQVKDIKDLKMNVKKMLIRQEAEIDIIALDIKSGLMGHPVDVNALNTLIDKKYELKKDKTKQLVQAYAQLKNGLSKPQYEKMKEIWKSK